MNYNQLTVPMLPGYSLGGLISKWNLALPYLEKQRGEISRELAILEDEKAKYKDDQDLVISYGQKILTAREDLKNTVADIKTCIANRSVISVEWSLPLDYRFSKVITENRAFRSERMDHLQFKSNPGKTNDLGKVTEQIQKFVKKLFLHDVTESILPVGGLECLAESVEDMLNNGGSASVVLIGSFITSERVRLMSPLRLVSVKSLNKSVKKNAADYYVLTEAVLGGVFLGIGKTFDQMNPDAPLDDKLKNSLISVNFISQGVIPKLNPKVEDVNLWTVYTDWQTSILNDDKSGYPIGFKVRSLVDVLAENEIDYTHLLEQD